MAARHKGVGGGLWELTLSCFENVPIKQSSDDDLVN